MPPTATLHHTATDTWATFVLAGEVFALKVEDVQEVLMDQPLTPVPLAPQHIVGLLNLRGNIMPAIDLRTRLRFPPLETEQEGNSLLVVKLQDRLISLLVDEIGDVLELPSDAWRDTPETVAAEHRDFVFGICPVDRVVVLGLSVNAVVADGDSTY